MKTEVKHSESKNAWNVINKEIGGKYKIARVPYYSDTEASERTNTRNKNEALEYAEFISECFNRNYKKI